MASTFLRKDSKFIWLRFKDEKGEWDQRSLGLRQDSAADRRKASEIEAEHTLKERQRSPGNGSDEDFDSWVLSWLDLKYESRVKTLKRYKGIWKNLRFWLDKHDIRHPRQVRRELVLDYIRWRQKPDVPWLYKCGKNNALQEIKILRIALFEAMARGWVDHNAASKLGIEKNRSAEKPAMTDEEISKIRQELAQEPEWMSICFEIALHQALRLQQCAFPMTCVDLDRMTLTYPMEIVKGARPFSHPIDPRLVPLLQKLKAQKRKKTCEIPEMPSKAFWQFFKRIGMRHLCFHCTRVTWITRAAIGNVPIQKAMRFVNHASTEVHKIYLRLVSDDIKDVPLMIKLPEI